MSIDSKARFILVFLACVLVACSPSETVPGAAPNGTNPSAALDPVAFNEIKGIISQRCLSCHADRPTQAGFNRPADGLSFDTPAQIKAEAQSIHERVRNRSMPPFNNLTAMTDAERERIRIWFEQGANL